MARKISYKNISELRPISCMTTDADGNYIKVSTVIIPAARIALRGTSFLEFNFRFHTIPNCLNFNSNSNAFQCHNCKVVHSILIVTCVASQPTLPACN